MAHLHAAFSKHLSNYRDVMIWAASCLVYFRLFRVREFTTLSPDHFDPSMDLLLLDVALDNWESAALIKQLKGDQFRKGVQIYSKKLATRAFCPVHALVQYLAR